MNRNPRRICLTLSIATLAGMMATSLMAQTNTRALSGGSSAPASNKKTEAKAGMHGHAISQANTGISSAPAATAAPPEMRMDAMVLSKMHHMNQVLIKMGDLAMKKGTTGDVRAYGERLRNDHQLADNMVIALAAKEGITLSQSAPTTPQAQHQAEEQRMMKQKLQKAQGPEFDRAFLNAMEKIQAKAIQTLTQAHEKLQDPNLRGLIGKMIPIVNQDLQIAKDVEARSSASQPS